jgi:hypothetical protein
MYGFIKELLKKTDYTEYPDIKPLGVAKTLTSLKGNFNEDMYDLYSQVRKLPVTKEEFLRK